MKKLIIGLVSIILLLLIAVEFYKYLSVGPALRFVKQADIHWMGYTREKVVALTFDDGPDPRYTPAVLAVLKRYRIPATFFVVGANVRQYPDLLKQEITLGHQIGNHTLTHPRLSRVNEAGILTQMKGDDLLIFRAGDIKTSFFRPPYEELTETILSTSRQAGKTIILSTVALERGTKFIPHREVKRVLKKIFPGAIILAHDGRLDRSRTVKALPMLIEGLQAKGYQIIPLNELLGT